MLNKPETHGGLIEAQLRLGGVLCDRRASSDTPEKHLLTNTGHGDLPDEEHASATVVRQLGCRHEQRLADLGTEAERVPTRQRNSVGRSLSGMSSAQAQKGGAFSDYPKHLFPSLGLLALAIHHQHKERERERTIYRYLCVYVCIS